MGQLIDGEWTAGGIALREDGRFIRQNAFFREAIEADPAARYPAEPGRYRLYVAHACPWAHRTLIARKLLGLEDVIAVSFVHPDMLAEGWEFREGYDDPVYGAPTLYALYQKAYPTFTGRVTVPTLFDEKTETIVNNESSEIIRFLGPAFGADLDLRPSGLVDAIDPINERVYRTLNNGVYRCGFAGTQEAYDEAVGELFDTLDFLEAHLEGRRWLVGDRVTEADVRLFPTLLRFDPVYYVHFKCSKRPIREYPNLWAYVERFYALPGVAETVDLEAIRRHYFYRHESNTPTRIVPVMRELDWPGG
jgi:putative glutathione S-transferase